MDVTHPLDRRQYLSAAGITVGSVLLAGCSDDGGGPEDTDDTEDDGMDGDDESEDGVGDDNETDDGVGGDNESEGSDNESDGSDNESDDA